MTHYIHFSNFLRSKVIAIDEKDPPWINEEIKCKENLRTRHFKNFSKKSDKNS